MGHLKTINFPFGTNGKLMGFFLVSQYIALYGKQLSSKMKLLEHERGNIFY